LRNKFIIPLLAGILILASLGFYQTASAGPPATEPDKVTDLTLEVLSDTEIKLTWTIPFDGGSTIIEYVIQSRVNNGPIIQIMFGDDTTFTFTDTALSSSKIGSGVDRLTSTFAIISSSFPVWWIGILMIFLFAFVWQIFPARATPSILPDEPGYFVALLYHMTLPLITIVMIGFGSWAYLVRNFMVGIMQEDFISAKKIMGISKKRIIYTHALKNAAPPIVTILALSLSGSLGGAIITEAVFDWPGMGRLYFEAITVMDLPIIIGATYILTVFFLASIFIADLLYGYFDPRVRTGT